MKFLCERDDLLEAVQFASRAISNRATLPVLSGLRLEADAAGKVRVGATDLEITMSTSFEAGVDEPGRAVVPGRLLGEMSRSLAAGRVTVAGGEGEVEISAGRGRFRVKSLAAEDYPELPLEPDATGVKVKVEAAELATALSQIVRSASSDESRQILTGVLWEVGSGELTLAATDSYRLGVRSVRIEGGPPEPIKVVLPARAVGEIARALQGASSVEALVKENIAVVGVQGGESGGQDSVIASRYIEGEFPNFRQLLPQGYTNRLIVDRESLLEVTKRVGLLAQNNLPVKLRLASELEISAHTPDVGEGQDLLDAEYEGESFVIAFNPQFLYDGASAVQAARLVMEAGDGLRPAILKGEGDEAYTYLLMPVRLS